ncbi:DJ-1/PfpI family protein [Pseudomonas lini]
MPAFTQALDTIVTANLLHPTSFSSRTFGLQDGEVTSDLGLVIRPDSRLEVAALKDLNLLVVCGGYRTELKVNHELISLLKNSIRVWYHTGRTVEWGVVFLGVSGLLEGYRCAIHPEHRPALAEISKSHACHQ